MQNLKVKILAYNTAIIPVILYGCNTWLQPSGKSMHAVFNKMVLSRTFGPKKEEVK
jgi:hypothetical protein